MAEPSRKDEIRRRVLALRHVQPDKDELSRRICQNVVALKPYVDAHTVMLYIDARSEVRTGVLLDHALLSGKVVAIPYCDGDELVPWRIESLDELAPGAFGIREPKPELREVPTRLIDPQSIDFICVPGVAFDRHGNRLGSGRGYYDRLLPKTCESAIKVGLAYECQLVETVQSLEHDVPMDRVITQSADRTR